MRIFAISFLILTSFITTSFFYANMYIPSDCQDRDKDGICNEVDTCPDLFGVKENNGCPIVSIEHDEDLGFISVTKIPDIITTLELVEIDDYTYKPIDTVYYTCKDYRCPSSIKEAIEMINSFGNIYNLSLTVSVHHNNIELAHKKFENLSFTTFTSSEIGFVKYEDF